LFPPYTNFQKNSSHGNRENPGPDLNQDHTGSSDHQPRPKYQHFDLRYSFDLKGLINSMINESPVYKIFNGRFPISRFNSVPEPTSKICQLVDTLSPLSAYEFTSINKPFRSRPMTKDQKTGCNIPETFVVQAPSLDLSVSRWLSGLSEQT
jgi:hypothetical protein